MEPDDRCNGQTRAADHHLCDQPAGTGTDHPGEGRCYFHGGNVPSGPESPHWKTGKYSKVAKGVRRFLSGALGKQFDEVRNDTELLGMADDVALVTLRRNELVAALSGRESGETWHALAVAHRKLRKALDDGDEAARDAAIQDLNAAIHEGSSRYAKWAEVFPVLNQRARLIEAETARAIQAQQVLTGKHIETFMAIAEGALRKVVAKYVSDPAALAALGDELARAIGIAPGKPPEGER